MDVTHGDFIWNLHKEKVNVLKHGVDFKAASQVFNDLLIRIFVDEVHSDREERYFGVGRVNGRILTVRFMYRHEKIRIIGAGYWRKGKEMYEKRKN